MKWETIQSNEICTTVEAVTANGKLTVNLDKDARGTVLYPATTTFGIARQLPCGCLEDVGHVLVTDSSFAFKELDTADQLVCLAHGIAEVTGTLAVLEYAEEVEWSCEVCLAKCEHCNEAFPECPCHDEEEDPESDTYNCGCCKCCGCSCD